MSKNLFKKLLEVRKAVPYIQKTNPGHQYNYVGSSDVLGALREKMDEVGLLLFPKVKDSKVTVNAVTNKDKYGNDRVTQTFFTELQIDFEWVDADTGESMTVPFYAQGIDIGGEKGVGKALTYAEKYFLLKQFNIATDQDDPDAFQQRLYNSIPNYIKDEQVKELRKMTNKLAELREVPASNFMNILGINTFERIPSDQFINIRSKLYDWLKQAQEKDNEGNVNNGDNNAPVDPLITQQQIKELSGIVNDISKLKNVPAETVINGLNRPLTDFKQSEFNSVKGTLVGWLNKAKENNQGQPPQSDNPENLFILINKEVGKTPSGADFIKLFVEGQQSPIFARSEQAVGQAFNLNVGDEFTAIIHEQNGFTFLESIQSVNQVA